MAAYEYLAMCNAGRRSRGVQEADSLRQARQLLRERNLVPLQVRPARAAGLRSRPREHPPAAASAPPSWPC